MASTLLIILIALVAMIVASARFRVHPFFSLLVAAICIGFSTGLNAEALLAALQKGFGDLMGYIGLVVVLGSILGVALEKSGAALRLADGVLTLIGRKRPALAMSLIGALVGIPVFCDSGFIILSGLKNALAKKTQAAKATLALALASGLYASHTLIPPTPGPIAAAGNLGASDYLGLVMLLGMVVAIPGTGIAYWWANKRGPGIQTQLSPIAEPDEKAVPGLLISALPLVVPILLIAFASVVSLAKWEGGLADLIRFSGQPVIALLLGTALAFAAFPAPEKAGWVEDGVKLAGPILIITGAGGALGGVLKATPLAKELGDSIAGAPHSGFVFLGMAFLLAALLKTMQGSSTSSLVITTSILAPLLPAAGFDSGIELSLMVLATGCGAMTVSHANDSYFWVVTQFSGISVRDAYRSYTVMTGLQGLAAISTVMLLYLFLA